LKVVAGAAAPASPFFSYTRCAIPADAKRHEVLCLRRRALV